MALDDNFGVRWVSCVGSLIVHAVVITALWLGMSKSAPIQSLSTTPTVSIIEVAVEPAVEDEGDGGGGGGGGGEHVAMALPSDIKVTAAANPWAGLTIGEDTGDGTGNGNGNGQGHGQGHGQGVTFGSIRPIEALPATPKPFVSKKRPAKLLHPTRQTEVEEAELFVAVVTVDESGDVVGAHMTQSHPGSRGETASSMIWQFRYSPALDDDGAPMRSTFTQSFAVR
jgi:hypothetical protein